MIVSQKLRDSARDQDCTLNIAGVCSYTTETTVLAHLPDESNGMGKKPDDISACFACSNCHDEIERKEGYSISAEDREFYFRRAMIRTWRKWIDMGLVSIKGMK